MYGIKPISIALLLVSLAGCDDKLVQPAPSLKENKEIPAKFEIRDVKTTQTEESQTYVKVNIHTTLVTKEDRLRNGTYSVWLSGKRSYQPEERIEGYFLMRDGVAIIDINDYAQSTKLLEPAKITEWRLDGYSKLQQGELIGQP